MNNKTHATGRDGPGIREHPQRLAIASELHARPFESLTPPLRATHLAMLGADAQEDRRHVETLCDAFEQVRPPESATHHSVNLGAFHLRWERHTEFSTYTFFCSSPYMGRDEHFTNRALDRVPPAWREAIPGELVAAVHLILEGPADPERSVHEILELFGTENVAGSMVADGGAHLFTDFRLHGDGFGHILIQAGGLPARRTGRLVQRVLEIETYRLMALLAFPIARRTTAQLTELDDQLRSVTDRMSHRESLESEQALLTELSGLAGELERITAQNTFRLSAAHAYRELVENRIDNLREERIKDLQTISEFMERRFTPAMRTCESVALRQHALSERLSRAAELLRTRVDVALEAQNRDLLASMNQRTDLQLRLQQTVEGLSVVVLSYYTTGLLHYALRGVEAAGVALNVNLIVGASVPFIVVGMWTVSRLMRRRLLGKRSSH
ncbi:putative membrane-anchored protein [Natronocella acetinitrilica]|uniref:Membrane-anchored protein n=2 Tax=Natronocella acetinitrilica TaxID=414046 RepID=A0AAE3G5P9_9GAMM|nr:putative membrane-anchored protein [Natronocella acetinitrilica]